MTMSSTLARINKDLYNQLQEFAFQKHRNTRSAKTELEEAVKAYLTNQKEQEVLVILKKARKRRRLQPEKLQEK